MQKTSEATGDLIEYETTNKVTEKKKTLVQEAAPQEIYMPPKKCQQIIYDLRLI